MKNRKDFVNDLIIWINKNIEMPLKIDDVAIRSGYSKWHLQRLFFSETGRSLGGFIREKKLCLILEAVITTNEPLINIAGNDSNLLIVFYVQIMPDDFVMQLHRF